VRRPTTVLALTAAAATVALGIAVPAHAASPSMVRLSSAADDLSSYTDVGALAAGTRVQTALVLADPNVAGEQKLLADQEAGTAGYVTPATYNAVFGVPASTFDAAQAFATAHGLTVTYASTNHDYLLLTGTAAQAEKTFSVSLSRYQIPGLAKTYYASPDEPLVPAGLDITGVLGLDNMRGAHTFVETVKGSRSATTAATARTQSGCVADVCAGALNIDDFTVPYDLPAGYTGQGQKIGIFGEGDYTTVLSDLKVFEKDFHRTPVATKVISVGDDGTSTDGTDEWDLDTQSSSGIATGISQLDLYFGEDLSDASINATYAKWANDPDGPHQMNASFGECEPIAGGLSTPTIPLPVVGGVAVGSQSIAAYDAQEDALRQARAEGRTLFASAGDQGGSCGIGIPNAFENNGVPELNVPAGSVNAVGVGGTDLTTDETTGARVTETSANAAGGGSSFSIHADTYQQGITVNAPQRPLPDCVLTQEGAPDLSGALCRSLPDVSAECGNLLIEAGESGLNIYTGGQVQPVAGTSLSSPLNMGMWARVQSSDSNSAGYGFANLTFYRLGKEQYQGASTTSTSSSAVVTTTTATPTATASTASTATPTSTGSSTSTVAAAPTSGAAVLGLSALRPQAVTSTSASTVASTSPAPTATTTTTITTTTSGPPTASPTVTTTVTTTTAPTTFKDPFYDVTVGTNDQEVAATGYDQASGNGVPDVANIISDLPRTSTVLFETVADFQTTASGTGSSGSLAFTGLEAEVPAAALVLLAAGGGLALSVRRRKAAHQR
jgi:pseudomonalisin